MSEGQDILALKREPDQLTDLDWLTLCVYQEARGEIADGKAAVARVILNRAAHRFFSDGTIKGTVLAPSQFSWTCFDFVDGHYTRVCHTAEDTLARALKLYAEALDDHAAWDGCWGVCAQVKAGNYPGGSAYQALGPNALLYVNLAVSRPVWAAPAKLICQIGAHSFFRP